MIKTNINCVLSTKRIVLVVHVTLVKPNIMQKLNGMNIIIQLKAQNNQNNFEGTSATILYHLVISNAPKNAKTRKNLEASYIALWKPDLNEKKDLDRQVLFRNGVTKGK